MSLSPLSIKSMGNLPAKWIVQQRVFLSETNEVWGSSCVTYIISVSADYKELSHLTLHSFNTAGNALLPMVAPLECLPLPEGPPPPLPFSCQQTGPEDPQSTLLGFTEPLPLSPVVIIVCVFPGTSLTRRITLGCLSSFVVSLTDYRCKLRHVYLCSPTSSRFTLHQASFFLMHATLPSLQIISFSV